MSCDLVVYVIIRRFSSPPEDGGMGFQFIHSRLIQDLSRYVNDSK